MFYLLYIRVYLSFGDSLYMLQKPVPAFVKIMMLALIVRRMDPELSAWITKAKLYNQLSVMIGVSAVTQTALFVS